MGTNKLTADLEKRFQTIQGDIKKTEVAIGQILLASECSDVSRQIQEEYSQIEAQKNEYLQTINEISSLEEVSIELNKEHDRIKKQGAELSSEWQPLFEKLGEALVNSPDAVYESEYEPFRQPISELRKKEMDAREALVALQKQMENQSFMNRLLTQVQYTARSSTVSQLQKKLTQLYYKCGREIFSTGVLMPLYEECRLSAEVSATFAPCADLKRKVEENAVALSEYKEKIEQNNLLLTEKGVSSSVAKTIKEIEKQIEEKNQRQEEIFQVAGHDFSLKYIDPDGEEIMPFKKVELKEIVTGLNTLSHLRQDSVICRRKIQIISLTEKMDATQKKIDSLNHSISDNEEKIQRIHLQNNELQSKISDATQELNSLKQKRTELEQIDSVATKKISSE